MAKTNTIQFYRGPGIPPTEPGAALEVGEIAIDTEKQIIWAQPSSGLLKPIGLVVGEGPLSNDYDKTLWLDTTSTELGIPATYNVANNLTTAIPNSYVLDAYQGKVLKDYVDAQSSAISGLSDQINNLSEDFIVEQGTEGIWTYHKWNSGIAECWGTHEENMIINTPTEITKLYYKDFDLNLPTGLFNAIPKLNGNLYSISGGFITGRVPTTPNTLPLYLCSIGTPQNVPVKLDFHVIGTWK